MVTETRPKRRRPPVLTKIDNDFGSKWLGFSGKALGALGVWHNPSYHPANNVRIPPFVPNRVVSQRRFSGPAYGEIDGGKPIHKRIPSGMALNRMAVAEAPMSALVWYSGESEATGRGAGDTHWPMSALILWSALFLTISLSGLMTRKTIA